MMDISEALDVARAMIEAVKDHPVKIEGAVGYNAPQEPVNGGILGAIEKSGGKIISEEMVVGQMNGEMYRVAYRNKKGDDMVAYINSGRVDVDSFSEESLVFRAEDDPKEKVVDLFEQAREAGKQQHKDTMKTLEELDKLVPPSFRRVVLNRQCREVAKNIYFANGELSVAVFEPFKGAIAYPKNEKTAKAFFENQYMESPHRDTIEAYMLVGQLAAEGLI